MSTRNGQHPTPVGGCLLRIEALLPSLKSAERRLATFIMQQPQTAVRCTIEDLQHHTDTGYATVIRFCKKAGYGGYKDFKNALIADVTAPAPTLGESPVGAPITQTDGIAEIARKVFSFARETLDQTAAIHDDAALTQAVDLVTAGGTLVCIGTGTSAISAKYAETRFFRIGIPAVAESDPTHCKQRVSIMSPSDCLLAVSSSGRSAGVVEAARIAGERGVPVVSLCDFTRSPLAKLAHCNLHTTPRNAELFKDLEMPLIISQIALIDTLFAASCMRLGKPALQRYESTRLAAASEKDDG